MFNAAYTFMTCKLAEYNHNPACMLKHTMFHLSILSIQA